MYTTLISVAELQALPAAQRMVFDCSFDLANPAAGLAGPSGRQKRLIR